MPEISSYSGYSFDNSSLPTQSAARNMPFLKFPTAEFFWIKIPKESRGGRSPINLSQRAAGQDFS